MEFLIHRTRDFQNHPKTVNYFSLALQGLQQRP
jgi:hypothetical protein